MWWRGWWGGGGMDGGAARKLRGWVAVAVACVLLAPALVLAGSSGAYYRAKVVGEQPATAINSEPTLQIQLNTGPDKGKRLTVPAVGLNSASDLALPTYRIGDTVVVSATQVGGSSPQYAVVDHYRLPAAAVLLGVVVALAMVFAGWRGVGSLVGLGISLVVLATFVVPQIVQGRNPYGVALVGGLVIATLGIYAAHGFSRRTTLALISTYVTLLVAAGIAWLAVTVAALNGIATEDVSYLHQQLPGLNIQGLLTAGVMIGVLGVLDDITVGQAAAVDELRRANESLSWRELYRRGLRVGREHIASLINTLVLAYAGASLVFIVYVASVQNLPVWLALNSELVMEEVIRALVGSFALILAVPIATLLAAYFLTHKLKHFVG
jgi:uncharacterized membrane protein